VEVKLRQSNAVPTNRPKELQVFLKTDIALHTSQVEGVINVTFIQCKSVQNPTVKRDTVQWSAGESFGPMVTFLI
jgi:hypothetical protein